MMKIEDARIGQKVRNQNGQDAIVVNVSNSGVVHVDFGTGCYHYVPFPASDLSLVSDPCTSCEMAPAQCKQIADLMTARDQWRRIAVRQAAELTNVQAAYEEGKAEGERAADKKIAELERSVEAWTETAARHCRNEMYWREELEKLQKEALAEYRPLSEVAKCYTPTESDKLLMSQDASRVVEYLAAHGGWADISDLQDIGLSTRNLLRALLEARDVGRIRLADWKCCIVRD